MTTMSRLARCILVALVLLATVAPEVAAQEEIILHPQPAHAIAGDYDANTYVPPVEVSFKSGPAARAEFEVTYSGFSGPAQQAFAYAVELWSRSLTSPVVIRVDAEFAPLEENVLGAAAPRLISNFPGTPFRDTWYPLALAESIAGTNANGAQADIEATFNSDFENWYFGTDGQTPTGMFDFVSVVLHELGHGLGFAGSFTVDNGDDGDGDECPGVGAGFGCFGLGPARLPVVFDHFSFDAADNPLLSYPNPSRELAAVLESGQVFFDGPSALTFNEVPVDLYAPAPFEVGSSFAHLDEQVFPPGHPSSLMTPVIARAEAIHSPGGAGCSVLLDIGWEPGSSCLALVLDVEDPPVAANRYGIRAVFPNPASQEVAVRVEAPPGESVRLDAYDLLGRRQALLYEGPVPADGWIALHLDTRSWTRGSYLLRIQGTSFVDSRPFVHL